MKKKHSIKWKGLLFAMLWTISLGMVAQTVTVSGNVKDDAGLEVIGATIIVEGVPSNGTVTDIDGNYLLNNVPANGSLVFSYVGMKTQTVPVNGRTAINIVLRPDNELLDEVVVVGYGTNTRRSLISSVSTVNAEQIEALPVTNITQGLAGRSPGLIVTGSGGGINKRQNISIRGGGTPLVVIDGIIRDYEDFVAIAPEDIEGMSILKDASATAVYGSRATNGILQVSTKRGKLGKPSISYSFNQSWFQPAIWSSKLPSWERAQYANIARENDGLEPRFGQDAIQAMKDGSDPLNYPNTDWRRLVLNNWAPQTKHSIQMTGGTDANRYFISLGNINQQSLYKNKNNYLKRNNFRLSQESTIESIGLTTLAAIDGYLEETSHPYTSTASGYYGVFSHIQNKSPLENGVNKFGLPYDTVDNPVGETSTDTGYNKGNKNNVNGNLQLRWELPWIEGMALRTSGNYRYYIETKKQWRKDPGLYTWESEVPTYAAQPQLYHSTKTEKALTLQFFAEYKKSFDRHSLDLLAGYEQTATEGDFYWEERKDYIFPFDQMNIGPANTQTNGGYDYESGRAGYIGQLKYNFDNRYFVEASMRYDGSDNFPKNRRWGTFYSGSLGWSLGDEAFMEYFREKNIVNMLKLRASYGQVGLDNWGNSSNPYHLGRFEYLQSYNFNPKGGVINGVYVPGFSEGALPSPDITWFTTQQSNMGFDFASVRNQLYGSFDYFYYSTSGFLYSPDPQDIGYTDPFGLALPRIKTNGELRRGGIEFQLGWRDRIGDFTYDISANFTRYIQFWNRQPTEASSTNLVTYMNPYIRNTQNYNYYGAMLTNQGYYTDPNDVLNSPKIESSYNLTAGDIKYLDVNGDGKIDAADNLRLGKSSSPLSNYGININLGYKGWSLSTLVQGAPSFNMYAGDALRMSSGQTAGGMSVIYDFQSDFWTPENTGATFPRLMSAPDLNGNNNYVFSDFWLIDAAYIRLKDFNLGYDFKYTMLKNIPWLSSCRLSVTGQNIFTLSKITKYGLDPENSNMENYGYPNERVFAINLNLGF